MRRKVILTLGLLMIVGAFAVIGFAPFSPSTSLSLDPVQNAHADDDGDNGNGGPVTPPPPPPVILPGPLPPPPPPSSGGKSSGGDDGDGSGSPAANLPTNLPPGNPGAPLSGGNDD